MHRALLLVSYGSADPAGRADLAALEDVLAASVPQLPVLRAVSSPAVRRRLTQAGQAVPSPAEAMAELAARGVTELLVLPTHLVPGSDFAALQADAAAAAPRFAALKMAQPLLADPAARAELARLLAARCRAGNALLLAGHGADGPAGQCYRALARDLQTAGGGRVLLGVLRGEPGFAPALAALQTGGWRQVVLQPLLLTAGTHTRREISGPGLDSWAGQLRAAGLSVICKNRGLARDAGVRDIYLRRLELLCRRPSANGGEL